MFSHLASMQSGSKTPLPWINAVQISKNDFYNEKKQLSIQYESYRMGFDRWDSHRNMLLRTAFLEGKVLTLEFMEDFSDQALEAEQGPYTQGFDMVRYIVETYGDSVIPELWKDISSYPNCGICTNLIYDLQVALA